MLNLGTVQSFATLNSQGFESGINNLKRQGERFSKDMQKSFDSIGRSLTSLGSKMTTRLSLPLLGAGVLAVKTAANYETLRTSMDILNGSVEEGARNFERLKEFSARTPFQLGDLAKAQNMLQGFGMEADNAFNSIKMIGDIAAVSGGSIEGIGIAFGQAAAEGKLMTRDIRQLINQGVPAIKLLADTMGVAESEIFTLASQGKITFDILNQAFKDATSEGGMFADGMKKQSQTIGGVFSTLKDNVSLALGELGQTIADELNLKDVIDKLIANIQKGEEWFLSLSAEAKKFSVIGAGVAIALGPTLFLFGQLAISIGALIPLVKGLTAVMLANPATAIAIGITAVGLAAWETAKNVIDLKNAVAELSEEGDDADLQKLIDAAVEVSNAIDRIKKSMAGGGRGGMTNPTDIKNIERLNEEYSALLLQIANIRKTARDTVVPDDLIDSVEDTTNSVDDLVKAFSGVRVAVESIPPVSDVFDLDAMIDFNKQMEMLKVNVISVADEWANIKFDDKMFPVGSIGDMEARLAELREQLLYATDPETVRGLRNEMSDLEMQIEGTTKFLNFMGGVADTFTSGFGNGLSNIIVQSQNLLDTWKDFKKLLLSSAIQKLISVLLTGGLGGSGFLGEDGGLFGKIFGGLFGGKKAIGGSQAHTGGIVPGAGDKMMRLKGGEMVLTQSQQKALSMGGGSTSKSVSVNIRVPLSIGDREVWEANRRYEVSV